MGGRGASSGTSRAGRKYGTEYKTLYKSGNIKFVQLMTPDSATAPMETMTSGRVYVTVNMENSLKSISYYDKNNKRFKQIDLDHPHIIDGKKASPHTHKGYFHDEKGSRTLSPNEQKMVDKVTKTWYNYLNGK